MNLSKNLIQQIKDQNYFDPNASYLLAVSGGVDSMVLLHCFASLGLKISVAHVNYQLRAADSDADEALVQNFCLKNNIPFHLKSLNEDSETKINNEEKGIQEKARKIRYDWFKTLQEEFTYDILVTAHHAHDQVETMLLFLLRGTGTKGLRGMQIFNKQHWRPFLHTSKAALETYAIEYKVPFRQDKSNFSTKYLRNQIRLELIPAIEKIQNNYLHNFLTTSQNLSEAVDLEAQLLLNFWKSNAIETNSCSSIELSKFQNFSTPNLIFFKLFEPKGFNRIQTNNLWEAAQNSSESAHILSEQYKLSYQRGFFYLEELSNESVFNLNIEQLPFQFRFKQFLYEFSLVKRDTILRFEPTHLYLNADKLTLPIEIRKVKPGEKFSPLGMQKQQLISDFLINRKSTSIEKESTLVLLVQNEIAAVLPWRIHNSFAVSLETKEILCLKIKKAGT
jgi:tRNA(Ile)-lysidine synthase